MWQQRCLQIVEELADSDDVFYVDRLSDAMATMSDGASNRRADRRRGDRGQLSLIAECDEPELVRARQRFPALIDAMRVVRLSEATAAQTIALLEPYGQRTVPRVALDHDAARRLIELLAAFRRDTAFPGKALAFIDYLATRPGAAGADDPRASPTRSRRGSGLPVELLAPERALGSAAIAAQLSRGRDMARTRRARRAPG